MKATKKILSVFLAVLMACTCLTGTLPTIAGAVATSGQWNALRDAVTAAGSELSTGKFKVFGGASSTTRTIEDSSATGAIFNVVDDLYAIINAEMGKGERSSYNYPSELNSRMDSVLASNLGSLYSDSAKTALDALVDAIVNNSNFNYNRNSQYRSGEQEGSVPAGLGNPASVNITVTRTLDSAILSYDTVESVPDEVELSYRITVNAAAYNTQESRFEDGGACGSDKTYYRRVAWYYFSGMSLSRNVSTGNPDLSALKAYFDYFTTEQIAVDPYTAYTFETRDQLQALVDQNTAVQAALSDAGINTAIINKFAQVKYGASGTGVVDAWTRECASALTYYANLDKVEYLNDNIMPLDETLFNSLDYENGPAVDDSLRELYNTGKSNYDFMENTVRVDYVTAYNKYIELNGYQQSALQTKLAALKYYIDCWDLAALKAEIDAYLPQHPVENMEQKTDAEVTDVYTMLSGYVNTINSYSQAVIDCVFTDGTDYITSVREAYRVEMVGREAEAQLLPYINFFAPYIEQYENGMLPQYSNATIRDKLIPEATQKFAAFQNTYTSYASQLPEGYLSPFAEYGDRIQAYVNALPQQILSVVTAEIDNVINMVGGWDKVSAGGVIVSASTYQIVKPAVDLVEDDMYSYLLSNYSSLVSSELRAKYNALSTIVQQADEYVANFLDRFQHMEYDAATGYYTIREGGLAGDLARVEGEDYTVDNKALETLIDKIDTFLSSSEFTDLMAQIMENGNIEDSMFTDEDGNVMDLNEFIWSILNKNLFTDEIITTIMQAFYPMIYTTIMDMIPELLASYNPMDLGSLGVSDLRGTLWLYLNGDKGSATYESLFNQLGIRLTPTTMAASPLIANYPAVKAALEKGADNNEQDRNDWDEVDWENMTWGVTDYDSFVAAMAACLDGISPLLRTLLANTSLNARVNNAAYAKADLEYKFLIWIPYELSGLASANISIPGIDGFRQLIIPIYEALGLTRESGYSFAVPSQGASTAEILDCILSPILELVNRMTNAPLDTVMKMLPNLMYGLITDQITALIGAINLNIHAELELDVDGGSLGEAITQLIVNAVEDNLKFDVPLNVGELLGGSLSDMLPFDLTDINAMIDYIVSEVAGISLDVPTLNSGAIVGAADLQRNVFSYRPSGTRNNFVVDRADLLWVLWDYIATAVGNRDFLNQILTLASPDEPIELPEMVYDILDNLSMQPDQALAAVTELLVPNVDENGNGAYAMTPYEWYTTDMGVNDAVSAEDFAYAYLNYTNDWTEAAALGVVSNLDAVLNDVLAGSADGQTAGDLVNSLLNSLFTNANLTALIKVMAENLGALGTGAIGNLIRDKFDVDMGIWTAQYADLFALEEVPVFDQATIDRAQAQLGALTGEADADGNIQWSLNGAPLVDGDREQFKSAIILVMSEFAPLFNKILLGEDIELFDGAIQVIGYDTYDAAIIPLVEALGVDDVLTQAEFAANYSNDADAGLEYIIDTLFAKLDEFTAGDMVGEILDVLPGLLYFLQSGGLSDFVLNLAHPLLVILDAVRPIFDLDVNSLLQGVIDEAAAGTNENYDPEDEDRYMIDITNLDLNAVYALVEAFTGIEVSEPLSYAIEGLVKYSGVEDVASKSVFLGNTRKTITFSGDRHDGLTAEEQKLYTRADTLTVLISLVLDLAKYPGNAEKIDALIGDDSNIMQTIVALLDYDASALVPSEPDWFYMVEAAPDADSLADFIATSEDRSAENISYVYYTQQDKNKENLWSQATAEALSANLAKLVDTILVETSGADLNTTLANLFAEANIYSDYTIAQIGHLLAGLLTEVPEAYLDLIGVVVDADLSYYDQFTAEPDESLKANTLTKDEFAEKLAELVKPASKLLDWLLFGKDMKFFYGMDGTDALVVPGNNGYQTGLAPILEALQIAAPAAEEGATTETMIVPVINAVLNKIDEIVNAGEEQNALQVILNHLPNILYFLNAGGLTTSVNNLLLSVNGLLAAAAPLTGMEGNLNDLINQLLADEGIAVDLNDLSFGAVANIVTELTGIEIQDAVALTVTDNEGNEVNWNYLDDIFLGKLEENTETVTGMTSYRAVMTEKAQADLITILLCSALDIVKYDANKEPLTELLGADVYDTIMTLLTVDTSKYEPNDPNWFYMVDPAPETDEEKSAVIADSANLSGATISYIRDAYKQDGNLWTTASADFLSKNLVVIIDMIVEAKKGADLNTVLATEFANGKLYSQYNLDQLRNLIGGLLAEVPDLYLDLIGVVLDADLSYYTDFAAAGEVDESLKDVILTKEEFAQGLAELIAPAAPVLDWVLFGKDITAFYTKEGDDALVIPGNDGYKTGLVPILEALQIEAPDPADYENPGVESMASDVLLAIMNKLDTIVNAGDGEAALQTMLDMLPNIVYFINAGGLTASVNNLLLGVNVLFEAAAPLTGLDGNVTDLINGLLADEGITLDLNNIDFSTISDVLAAKLGLYIEDAVSVTTEDGEWNYLKDLYVGQLVDNTANSVSGMDSYMAVPTEDGTTQRDVLTVLLCGALDIIKYPANEQVLVGWFGQNVYDGIMNVFALKGDGAYQDVSWMYTDGEGNILDEYKDKIFSPLKDLNGTFDYGYDEYWTREKATYVAENLNDFINGLIKLLGVEIDGINLENLGDIINQLIGDNLYTNENAAALAKAVADLVAQFADYGDGLITEALKEVLGVDLTVYEKYASGNYDFGIESGNRDQFADAIVELLMPLEPILKVILTGEDLKLLVDKDGNTAVTIYGGEGYKYAIIPLLEAFDRDNPNIKTPEEYIADVNADPEALVRDILTPVFDVLDYVLADPMNHLLEVMPSLVYFINSNGVDTVFKNAIHPVTEILTAIEPITGPVNLYDVIGIDLSTIDFNYLAQMLLDMLGEGIGAEIAPAAINAIADMTMGKLVTYTSKNGNPAVTMEYVEGDASLAGSADMLTVLLRFALKWITLPENQETVKALISENIPNAETAEYVLGTYETLCTYLDKPHGINMMLGVVYYIFYGLDIAVGETNEWFDDVNGKWQFIIKLFDGADSDYLSNFGDALHKLFGFTEDVIDEEGIASNGLIAFFQKIINWFKAIIEWIKDLFAGIGG